MQGFALAKPHGYAGDFELIDRFYQRNVSPDPQLAAWDHYAQRHPGAQAVRNRKTYFHEVLDRHHGHHKTLRVLNIGSGPGRCMFEWLLDHPGAEVSFCCIEIDPEAIAYASRLNERFLDRITFTQMNILRFRPAEQFDVVWAADIFDYFTDSVFQSLLLRLIPAVAAQGELIVGNFSDRNPSRPYMELLGDWRLYHRAAESLISLARSCGVAANAIRVGTEPEGVNLFLHITPHQE